MDIKVNTKTSHPKRWLVLVCLVKKVNNTIFHDFATCSWKDFSKHLKCKRCQCILTLRNKKEHFRTFGGEELFLKEERYKKLLKLIEENNYLKVSEAARLLNVTEMTIRRDFDLLEKEGFVERVHGGAKKKETNPYTELSHIEKKTLNVELKKQIAKKAAELIQENEAIFIGPGTTNELIYDYLEVNSANIITNSISIFNRFQHDKRFELVLIGGRLRERTGTFVGYLANNWIKDIKVQKAFIGTNGIKFDHVTTADEEELTIQQIILGNSQEKYVVADSTKFGVEAFQVVTKVQDITGIITDTSLTEENEAYYEGKCRIIK